MKTFIPTILATLALGGCMGTIAAVDIGANTTRVEYTCRIGLNCQRHDIVLTNKLYETCPKGYEKMREGIIIEKNAQIAYMEAKCNR